MDTAEREANMYKEKRVCFNHKMHIGGYGS